MDDQFDPWPSPNQPYEEATRLDKLLSRFRNGVIRSPSRVQGSRTQSQTSVSTTIFPLAGTSTLEPWVTVRISGIPALQWGVFQHNIASLLRDIRSGRCWMPGRQQG